MFQFFNSGKLILDQHHHIHPSMKTLRTPCINTLEQITHRWISHSCFHSIILIAFPSPTWCSQSQCISIYSIIPPLTPQFQPYVLIIGTYVSKSSPHFPCKFQLPQKFIEIHIWDISEVDECQLVVWVHFPP